MNSLLSVLSHNPLFRTDLRTTDQENSLSVDLTFKVCCVLSEKVECLEYGTLSLPAMKAIRPSSSIEVLAVRIL